MIKTEKLERVSPHTVKVEIKLGNLQTVLDKDFTLDEVFIKVLEPLVLSPRFERFGDKDKDGWIATDRLFFQPDDGTVKGLYLFPLKDKNALTAEIKTSFVPEVKIKTIKTKTER